MLTLRKATSGDCIRVYRWRNRAEDRKHHFQQEAILLPDHIHWWMTNDSAIYIAAYSDVPCGYVAIELQSAEHEDTGIKQGLGSCKTEHYYTGAWEVDITVDVDHRGKGLGVDMLHSALAAHGKGVYIAYIKTDNVASVSVFCKAGFTMLNLGWRDDEPAYTYQRVTT